MHKMDENDIAKIAYAKIILAIYDIKDELETNDCKIEYPDHIFVNESGYGFRYCSELRPSSKP